MAIVAPSSAITFNVGLQTRDSQADYICILLWPYEVWGGSIDNKVGILSIDLIRTHKNWFANTTIVVAGAWKARAHLPGSHQAPFDSVVSYLIGPFAPSMFMCLCVRFHDDDCEHERLSLFQVNSSC